MASVLVISSTVSCVWFDRRIACTWNHCSSVFCFLLLSFFYTCPFLLRVFDLDPVHATRGFVSKSDLAQRSMLMLFMEFSFLL